MSKWNKQKKKSTSVFARLSWALLYLYPAELQPDLSLWHLLEIQIRAKNLPLPTHQIREKIYAAQGHLTGTTLTNPLSLLYNCSHSFRPWERLRAYCSLECLFFKSYSHLHTSYIQYIQYTSAYFYREYLRK